MLPARHPHPADLPPPRSGRAGFSIPYRPEKTDLLPTIANLVGASTAGEIVEGDDLSGLFDAAARPPDRGTAFTKGHPEQYPCASVLSGRWHLIYSHTGRFYELYDVDRDPAEKENLVAKEGAVVGRLRPLLDAYFARFKIRHHSRILRVPIPKDME